MLSFTMTSINVTLKSAITGAKTIITMDPLWYLGGSRRSRRWRQRCRRGSPFLGLLYREILEEPDVAVAAYIDRGGSGGAADDGNHWWWCHHGRSWTPAGERSGDENDKHEQGKEPLHVELSESGGEVDGAPELHINL
jgi:hypothetical protein